MKFFDRLIAFNTVIVGIAIVIGIVFPSLPMPHMNTPALALSKPSISMPDVHLPDVDFKSAFQNGEPHVAGVFAEENEGETVAPTRKPSPTTTPRPTEIPIADPVSIEIPSLQLQASIVQVGITPDYSMDIPKDFSTVGWYEPAGKPGEEGSAILNGHFDNPSGSPAAFYNLKKLQNGDEIIITAADNKRYTFTVEDVYSHPLEAFPHDLLYGDPAGKHLKLLTCDGIWNPQNMNYSNRLVVAAVLSDDSPAL